MLTYPKSTMHVRRIPMHLSSGHMTLMQGKFYPPPIFPQSDLGRRADSRWALPQISSNVYDPPTYSCVFDAKRVSVSSWIRIL